MSTPALLEVVGEALLGSLAADPAGAVVDRARLAREAWSAWGRDRDGAGRKADLHALQGMSAEEQDGQVQAVVRRLLPGRADPIQLALGRYLAVLPTLLTASGRPLEQADDLLRRLPARVPAFRLHDQPAGIGDRRLTRPVLVTTTAEVWLASNPRVPRLRPVLLAFYPDLTADPEARDRFAAYLDQLASLDPGRLLPPEQTFLEAPIPSVQFTAPDSLAWQVEGLSPEVMRKRFVRMVRIFAELHRQTPPIVVGPIETGQILAAPGADSEGRLLLPNLPLQGDPRDDVLTLGLVGRHMLGADDRIGDILVSCLATDRLARPADAGVVLERIESHVAGPGDRPASAAPPPLAPARARPRRGADVNRILGELQNTTPEIPKLLTNSLGMRFVLIAAGTFPMGSPPDEMGRRDNEGPVHTVVFSRPFYMAVHPITQEQFERVMGVNPAHFQAASGGGPDHPVECVSWENAAAWCQRASEREPGRSYRLPTEAEWEFACRAGSNTAFSFGPGLSSSHASFDGTHPYARSEREAGMAWTLTVQRTTPVGSFEANHFGLYDMHGNVWEWCADWYDGGYYKQSPRQDPAGPATGLYRVLRGGSWKNQAVTCRSAYRNALTPNQRQPTIGFRVVLDYSS